MRMEIKENGKDFNYKKVNWVQIQGGTLTMSYIDEAGEEHKEYGPIPEFIKVDSEERCHEEAIIESAPHAIQRIRDEILEAHKMRLDLVRYGGESK